MPLLVWRQEGRLCELCRSVITRCSCLWSQPSVLKFPTGRKPSMSEWFGVSLWREHKRVACGILWLLVFTAVGALAVVKQIYSCRPPKPDIRHLSSSSSPLLMLAFTCMSRDSFAYRSRLTVNHALSLTHALQVNFRFTGGELDRPADCLVIFLLQLSGKGTFGINLVVISVVSTGGMNALSPNHHS